MATPEAALRVAMKMTDIPVAEVRTMCLERFAARKFSELQDHEKWTLVCMIDPEVEGPYGETMKEF